MRHQTSDIGHQTLNIGHQPSGIRHRTSSLGLQTVYQGSLRGFFNLPSLLTGVTDMQTLLIIYKWQKTIIKQHHLTDNSRLILNQGPSTYEVTYRSFFWTYSTKFWSTTKLMATSESLDRAAGCYQGLHWAQIKRTGLWQIRDLKNARKSPWSCK